MNADLMIAMVQRMSVVVTLAFILSQTAVFRRFIYRRIKVRDSVILTVFFGLVGILETYAGIPVDDALANSRVIGVMAAGLIGGKLMGVGAGLIAGGHRYFLGGFTAFSCALANICEGLLAGFIRQYYPGRPIPWWVALISGLVGEIMQMGIILLTARPYDMALELVQKIAVPMIVVNSIGLAVFMIIIKTAIDTQERAGAEQAQKVLEIANETLPYLRHGLNHYSAGETAKIILASAGYDAVAITDARHVLAFAGLEAEHHAVTADLTHATRQVLAGGSICIAQTKQDIGCPYHDCKLASAVVVPLTRAGEISGTIKLYYRRANAVGQTDIAFATGLAQLFSTQLELAEIDYQAKAAARAKLKALQAQINPHFLFNTLNTITSLVRTNPDLARELLLKLGAIFRFVLHKAGKNITIAEELAQVRAYLAIEKARYGDKLRVEENIDAGLENCYIPSLSIQPLVENAVKHGLQPQENGGKIKLGIREAAGEVIEIQIADDGVGLDLSRHNPLKRPDEERVGLRNVDERLRGQFGAGFGVAIASEPGTGTTVTMRLPKLVKEVEEYA